MSTMSRQQAALIVKELKSGKFYRTRFQEQEWGINYLDENRFREWGREADLSGYTNGSSFEKEITEDQLIELLLKYNYERTRAGLQEK